MRAKPSRAPRTPTGPSGRPTSRAWTRRGGSCSSRGSCAKGSCASARTSGSDVARRALHGLRAAGEEGEVTRLGDNVRLPGRAAGLEADPPRVSGTLSLAQHELADAREPRRLAYGALGRLDG